MMLVTALPIITTQELRPTHDVIRRISAEHSKPERALGPADYHYVVEAAVAWSQKHEEGNPADVQATLTASLQDITTDMGQLLHCAVHRWRYAHTGRALGRPYLFDSDLGLAVAGDWCLGIGAEGAPHPAVGAGPAGRASASAEVAGERPSAGASAAATTAGPSWGSFRALAPPAVPLHHDPRLHRCACRAGRCDASYHAALLFALSKRLQKYFY